ncbi:MAG: hypothetical protein ACYTJ0_01215, partial [Planctomycetota bacterium]
MTTRGRSRALCALAGAGLAAMAVAVTTIADDGGRPSRPEMRDPVRAERPSAPDQRLDVVGVYDANGKPVAVEGLVVKIDDTRAVKAATSRDGRRYRAELPAGAIKAIIEVDHPLASGSVGVTLNAGPLTEVELYLIDGELSAKLRPAPAGSLGGL